MPRRSRRASGLCRGEAENSGGRARDAPGPCAGRHGNGGRGGGRVVDRRSGVGPRPARHRVPHIIRDSERSERMDDMVDAGSGNATSVDVILPVLDERDAIPRVLASIPPTWHAAPDWLKNGATTRST